MGTLASWAITPSSLCYQTSSHGSYMSFMIFDLQASTFHPFAQTEATSMRTERCNLTRYQNFIMSHMPLPLSAVFTADYYIYYFHYSFYFSAFHEMWSTMRLNMSIFNSIAWCAHMVCGPAARIRVVGRVGHCSRPYKRRNCVP
jgi:hypothetical protein